ncbi:hypothetical protein MMC17_004847 [Xylographa soralifera]|nr:hypothetical protein [Xylographa soralifera]
MDNFDIPGLNDDENLFDFEADSSNTPWASTHNDLANHTQTVQADEVLHMVPLTHSEEEAILAVRASNAQNHRQGYPSEPPELPLLHTNFSGIEEPGAFGASLNYDNVGSLLQPNFGGFNAFDDAPDYANTQLNALGGFAHPQLEELAEEFGALTDRTPYATGQSG